MFWLLACSPVVRESPRPLNEWVYTSTGKSLERAMLEPDDGTVSKASLLARQTTDPVIEWHRASHFLVNTSSSCVKSTPGQQGM